MNGVRAFDLDYETYCDLDIRKVGSDVYTAHPSCEVVLAAYDLADGLGVRQWRPAEGEPIPDDLRAALLNPKAEWWAHNASFERQVTSRVLGIDIPIERWRDTMIMALYCALPAKLLDLSRVLGLPADKKKHAHGNRLIRKFCSPSKSGKRTNWFDDPDAWDDFCEYNVADVYAEAEVRNRLRRYAPPQWVWEMWFLDQKINAAGVPVNLRMVDAAIKTFEKVSEEKMARFRGLTGLEKPNAPQALKEWLQERGYPFDDVRAVHVKRALARVEEKLKDPFNSEEEEERAEELKEALELRQQLGQSAVKKFYALKRATNQSDGVLRNAFQFLGASRTGRFAGRVFQPQNLPRPDWRMESDLALVADHVEHLGAEDLDVLWAEPLDVLKSSIRSAVQAIDGHLFADADLSAIENRGIGWITNDREVLRVFEMNRDPYIDFASSMFGKPYGTLWAEYQAGDKKTRKIAKPGTLGCGYMLSAGEVRIDHDTGEEEATGLLGYGRAMGVDLTPELAELSVRTFRNRFKGVASFWKESIKAIFKVMRTGQPVQCRRVWIDRTRNFLRIHLPSGRALHYFAPALENRMTPWGEKRLTFTYRGMNNGKWMRLGTHGGKVLENVTQAVALDLLLCGLRNANDAGLDIRLHVHDQIVVMSPKARAEKDLETLIECMTTPPDWGKDFPLGADGFVSPVFTKD